MSKRDTMTRLAVGIVGSFAAIAIQEIWGRTYWTGVATGMLAVVASVAVWRIATAPTKEPK